MTTITAIPPAELDCYLIANKRPHLNLVCRGDRVVGKVLRDTRLIPGGGGARGPFYTAVPSHPSALSYMHGVGASIGTRYPTRMQAFRALCDFDRIWTPEVLHHLAAGHIERWARERRSFSRDTALRLALGEAIESYRRMNSIASGKRFVCHV